MAVTWKKLVCGLKPIEEQVTMATMWLDSDSDNEKFYASLYQPFADGLRTTGSVGLARNKVARSYTLTESNDNTLLFKLACVATGHEPITPLEQLNIFNKENGTKRIYNRETVSSKYEEVRRACRLSFR